MIALSGCLDSHPKTHLFLSGNGCKGAENSYLDFTKVVDFRRQELKAKEIKLSFPAKVAGPSDSAQCSLQLTVGLFHSPWQGTVTLHYVGSFSPPASELL